MTTRANTRTLARRTRECHAHECLQTLRLQLAACAPISRHRTCIASSTHHIRSFCSRAADHEQRSKLARYRAIAVACLNSEDDDEGGNSDDGGCTGGAAGARRGVDARRRRSGGAPSRRAAVSSWASQLHQWRPDQPGLRVPCPPARRASGGSARLGATASADFCQQGVVRA